MSELPEHFWLHMTSSVALVLLALVAMAAILAWTVRTVEDLWQGHSSRRH
jgi:succinate dehydrogenase hydrophobic anchor subunit